MNIKTTEMSAALKTELSKQGWASRMQEVLWGRRVQGNMHGVTIEKEGVEKYYAGPFAAVSADGQIAIVRFG